ncbi:glycosyl hydrolase [Haloferula sp. A504]|uniref:glycosyl hydrolase n=1 Tax=Haloferula sp. A504 TaxID=3373601 RepID=UPI0031BF2E74|nr:hypothetical protein [Verrucomicrobiaceae bacterium E54]
MASHGSAQSPALQDAFQDPPNPARPGAYWYFMDGNLDREEMTRDLESMKAAGMGHVVWLEVNVGVPRGPVEMLSPEWMKLLRHGVDEARRLGIDVTLGVGPGWTGTGGPWIKPEESMQHLVYSETTLKGPATIKEKLPIAPQRARWWKMLDVDFYEDVAVYAFPATEVTLEDADQVAFYQRSDYMHGSAAFLSGPAIPAINPEEPAIDPEAVIDLTGHLNAEGILEWEVPAGEWTVLRFGRRSNGTSNRPASFPVVGLDHDKFSRELLEKHFEHYCQRLIDAAGPGDPDSQGGLVALHLDSWEMNAQNWSPGFLDAFQKRRGYDFTPWLPTLSGRVVKDRKLTERALWDFRLTIQELMLENYVGPLREMSHERGLKFSIEPYGGNQSNDLEYGAYADVPMCEFWSTKYDTSYSAIEAASIGHTLGLPIVSSEAFTGHRDEKGRHYPASLKNQADWALAMGVNHFQFHTFTHKALGEKARPGMTMGGWGVRWDRGQTWWPMVDGFHTYLSRCSHLLQQGTTVSDVLYLTPEGSPHTFIPPESALAGAGKLPDKKGYSFDGCSQGILKQMVVNGDRIGVPGATQYRLLVLPRFETMTPDLLRTIIGLVENGATVLGYPPSASPSLSNYPKWDQEVRRLAEELWGKAPYPQVRKFGKGQILLDAGAAEFLAGKPEATREKNKISIYPDYGLTAGILQSLGLDEDFNSEVPLRFTHRRTPEADIYFVSNPSEEPVETSAFFRARSDQPQHWDPITGKIRALPEFSPEKSGTRIPLRFEPLESYFVVFAHAASKRRESAGGVNFPKSEAQMTLEGPWEVSFDPNYGGPEKITFEALKDWTQFEEHGVRYYSGIATYRKRFEFKRNGTGAGSTTYLELGTVHDIARVRLNGQDLGVVWCAPWRVDITGALKGGVNQLEIEVANRWSNRLLGDTQAPDKDARTLKWDSGLLGGKAHKAGRYTFTTSPGPGELFPSGLLGPVRIMD